MGEDLHAVNEFLNVGEFLDAAAAKVDPAVWCYFEGGAGDEVTLRENLAAFSRWQLRPRMLVDVGEIGLETTLLGATVAMPLGIAPFALQRLLDTNPNYEGKSKVVELMAQVKKHSGIKLGTQAKELTN